MEIKISAQINASLEKVWDYWTQGEHVTGWNFASDDWHCPESKIDLRPGGEFHSTMAAKDGSFSFDFWGITADFFYFFPILNSLFSRLIDFAIPVVGLNAHR